MTDWYAWHQPYDDPDSPLSRRLRLVQRHIAQWLDERTDDSLSVVSVCAGQGRDLLDLLTARPDAGRVRARLIEYDDRNASIAGAAIEAARLANVTALRGDAGDLASYVGAVPADLVLGSGSAPPASSNRTSTCPTTGGSPSGYTASPGTRSPSTCHAGCSGSSSRPGTLRATVRASRPARRSGTAGASPDRESFARPISDTRAPLLL